MRRQLMTLALVALSSAACAGRQYDTQDTAPALPDSIFVDAYNDHFYDARVHAIYSGGQRRTLGTIAGNGGHARVALVWEPHALVFEIDFIISGLTYVSQPIDVTRGETVEVRLPPNIDQSGFFRRLRRS
ncbi:MAG TPA: hypothetical protein VFZ69_13820 [Longimicrobiales bacterium]